MESDPIIDLPVVTKAERRAYTVFRRFLINDGYDMIQFSVYVLRPFI